MKKQIFRLTVILFLLSPLLATQCEENIGPDGTWMSYTETQCADPWVNRTESSKDEKVRGYLEEAGIEVLDLVFENYSSGPFCAACTCPSGNYIKVLVPDNQVEDMKSIGFTE